MREQNLSPGRSDPQALYRRTGYQSEVREYVSRGLLLKKEAPLTNPKKIYFNHGQEGQAAATNEKALVACIYVHAKSTGS